MRAIDGDALINTLQELFDKREKEARFTGNRGVTVTWNDAIYHIKTAPTIETEQRWIPWDSGKFPEESGMYTVTAYDGATERVTYAKYQKRLKRWELTGARAYWRVLAWMPLPEPYEGEQE